MGGGDEAINVSVAEMSPITSLTALLCSGFSPSVCLIPLFQFSLCTWWTMEGKSRLDLIRWNPSGFHAFSSISIKVMVRASDKSTKIHSDSLER